MYVYISPYKNKVTICKTCMRDAPYHHHGFPKVAYFPLVYLSIYLPTVAHVYLLVLYAGVLCCCYYITCRLPKD